MVTMTRISIIIFGVNGELAPRSLDSTNDQANVLNMRNLHLYGT